MRLLIFTLLVLFGQMLNAQLTETTVPKNIVAFETGFWSRGMAGLTYGRNYLIKDKMHLSTDASIGAGFNIRSGAPNFFFTLNPMANFGKKNRFFMIGIKGQYAIYNTSSSTVISFGPPIQQHYKGFSVAPVIGYSERYVNGFTYKLRLSAFGFENMERWRPSLGVSFGYSF